MAQARSEGPGLSSDRSPGFMGVEWPQVRLVSAICGVLEHSGSDRPGLSCNAPQNVYRKQIHIFPLSHMTLPPSDLSISI